MGQYDIAQICMNGHVVTDSLGSYPQHGKKFCDKCGASTIYQCPSCNMNIPGHYESGVIVIGRKFPIPAFCHNCGQPYPWTRNRVEALHDMALEANELSNAEKDKLIESIPDLLVDTPRTTLAASRWKKALEKVSNYSAQAFREIMIEVISETAKRLLFP